MQKPIRERQLNWAVVGASGFVGKGIIDALKGLGNSEVRSIKAPRLFSHAITTAHSVLEVLRTDLVVRDAVEELVSAFRGVDVVVNAAGVAAPNAAASKQLFGANSLLPLVIAEAARRAGVAKFIHLSSAAVQGNKDSLDESASVNPFSPYSQSKALAEQTLEIWRNAQSGEDTSQPNSSLKVVVIRATSVQGSGRKTSNVLARIANSRLASVAKPGTQPSVVSSLQGLSEFVKTVGIYPGTVPPILIQPWEGASALEILELAGDGRTPLKIPRSLARVGVSSLKMFGRLHPGLIGIARRLEVMWFGQDQVPGWAVDNGLVPKPIYGPTDNLRRTLS